MWLEKVKELETENAGLRGERRWTAVEDRLPQEGDAIWLINGQDVLLCTYYRPGRVTKPDWFTHWMLIPQPLSLP